MHWGETQNLKDNQLQFPGQSWGWPHGRTTRARSAQNHRQPHPLFIGGSDKKDTASSQRLWTAPAFCVLFSFPFFCFVPWLCPQGRSWRGTALVVNLGPLKDPLLGWSKRPGSHPKSPSQEGARTT